MQFEERPTAVDRLAELVKTCQVRVVEGKGEPAAAAAAAAVAWRRDACLQPFADNLLILPYRAAPASPPPAVRQERGRVSRRLLLETQELGLLEQSGQVVGPGFKTREVRAHTKQTYTQSKCVVRGDSHARHLALRGAESGEARGAAATGASRLGRRRSQAAQRACPEPPALGARARMPRPPTPILHSK